MKERPYYRTIVVSDIHLGTTHSKVNQISDFLSRVDCGRLILNGDIIDGWHLQKSGISKWKAEHTHFLNHHEMMENTARKSFMYVAIMTIFLTILLPCNSPT